jgi:hypothetical protein
MGITPKASHIDGNAACIRFRCSKAIDVDAIRSLGVEPSISDDNGSLGGRNPHSSSDDDGCSSTSKHSRGADVDGQPLLAWEK